MSFPLNAVCENPQLLQRDIDKLQWYHRYVMLSGNSVCVELPEVSINPVFFYVGESIEMPRSATGVKIGYWGYVALLSPTPLLRRVM